MMEMTMSKTCNRCGHPLEGADECSVCLLQLGQSQPGPDQPAQFAMPTAEELNEQLPQLEITRLVGRGGMGAIYHARQRSLDRDVAVKLIAREVSGDTAFLERFQREAKTLAKLSHPNIVTIYDYGHTSEGQAYLIMEYVDGINLREAISSHSVGSGDALELVTKMCHALEYAHSKGVVHRDIKPENILLGEDGTLKIADFGIAKIVDDAVAPPTLTATRQVLGSLHYLAPEHLEAPQEVDHRVDLYALGVVLYELLTGQLPLGRYEPPSNVGARATPAIDALVMKSLNRKPAQRYQSAAEMNADLEQVASGDLGDQPPVAGPGPARSVSVPFTVDAMGGFAVAVGILHADADNLNAEFRIRDAIWGNIKGGTHVVDIPRHRLTRLELVKGVFGSKLIIGADKISTLGSFPNAEIGRVELNVARSDSRYGTQLVQTLGFATPDAHSAWKTSAAYEASDSKRVFFAVMLIICALLNGGALAISELLIVQIMRDGVTIAIPAIMAAITMGPLAILQLVTGIINLVGRPKALSITTSILSCLPVTPVWLFSCPIGIWALRWLTASPEAAARAAASKSRPSWGATTRLFVREMRWSRVFAALNVVGLIVLVGGIVAYRFGWYPVTMHFRVVDPKAAAEAYPLDRQVQQRLNPFNVSVKFATNRGEYGSEISVRTYQFRQSQVAERLGMKGDVQTVWLAPAPEGGSPTDPAMSDIPAVAGLDLGQVAVVREGIGLSVACASTATELDSAHVTSVRRQAVAHISAAGQPSPSPDTSEDAALPEYAGQGELIVELTAAGRENLNQSLPAVAGCSLGLVIDGLLQGVADPELISNQQIRFRLADGSHLSANAIVSGIRGPRLSSHLELID